MFPRHFPQERCAAPISTNIGKACAVEKISWVTVTVAARRSARPHTRLQDPADTHRAPQRDASSAGHRECVQFADQWEEFAAFEDLGPCFTCTHLADAGEHRVADELVEDLVVLEGAFW